MKIAIIGAGNVGGALAQAATKAGNEVTVAAADMSHAEKVASETGAQATDSNAKAVQDAEIVILAIPHGAVDGLVSEIKNELSGKIIIDATNPLNDSYSDLTTRGSSAAEQLQAKVPEASVVKAFNTVFATKQANPITDGTPLDGFYAGDDANAKAKVQELLAGIGYRPIDAGGLRMAAALEEMAFLNISLQSANGWPWQTGWKLVGPTA